jgi:hypothetical protein
MQTDGEAYLLEDGDGEAVRSTSNPLTNWDGVERDSRPLSVAKLKADDAKDRQRSEMNSHLSLTGGVDADGIEVEEESEEWYMSALWCAMLAAIVTLAVVAIAKGKNNTDNPLLADPDYGPSEVLGVMMLILCFIFGTENASSKYHRTALGRGVRLFYKYIPALFLCYFIPGLLGSAGVYGINSNNLVYSSVGSKVLLPAILVLLASASDIPEILKLGSKALLMFFTCTIGVMIGGPIAVTLMGGIHKPTVGGDDVWRGLAFVAGEWIGGGANGNAMIQIFNPPGRLPSPFTPHSPPSPPHSLISHSPSAPFYLLPPHSPARRCAFAVDCSRRDLGQHLDGVHAHTDRPEGQSGRIPRC